MSRLKRSCRAIRFRLASFKDALKDLAVRLYRTVTRKQKARLDFPTINMLVVFSHELSEDVMDQVRVKYLYHIPNKVALEIEDVYFEEFLEPYLKNRPGLIFFICRPQDVPALREFLHLMTKMPDYSPQVFFWDEKANPNDVPEIPSRYRRDHMDPNAVIIDMCVNRLPNQGDLPN